MRTVAVVAIALASAFVSASARADERAAPTIVFRATDDAGHDVTDASVEIDGKRTVAADGRAVDVDAGKHTIKVTRSGKKPFEDVIVVAQGEKDRVVVAKLGAQAPAKSRTPVASVVAWSISGVALLTFAGFGLKARVDYDDYEARCGNRCAESERDTVATSVTFADISLVVAVVAAGVGTYFFLTRPPPKDAAQ
jgi:hypothetical protein